MKAFLCFWKICHRRSGTFLDHQNYLGRTTQPLPPSGSPWAAVAYQTAVLFSGSDMGGTDDQIDRFCCIRLRPYNISIRNDSCASSPAGEHDHASRLRMRTVQDTN